MSIREWLISQGHSPEKLDKPFNLPVLDDIGNGLMLSLQNDDDIGNFLVMVLMNQDMIAADVIRLTEENEQLKIRVGELENA